MIIQIPKVWYHQILAKALYPKLPKIILDEDEIKELCIFPALQEYFSRFPIKQKVQYKVDQTLDIEYPDQDTFGFLNAQIVDKISSSGHGNRNSDFFRLVRYNNSLGFARGLTTRTRNVLRPSRASFGGLQYNYIMEDALINSQSQMNETYKIVPHPDERKIEVFVTSPASVVVTWAKSSLNWQDVKYTQRNNVVNLSASYLLQHLADSQAILEDANLTKKFNLPELKERAEKLRDPVLELWSKYPIVAVFRES